MAAGAVVHLPDDPERLREVAAFLKAAGAFDDSHAVQAAPT
jgi:hypothetical protein